MEEQIQKNIRYKRNKQIILFIGIIAIISGTVISYLSGRAINSIYFYIGSWMVNIAFALFINKICTLFVKKSTFLLFLPYLPILNSVINILEIYGLFLLEINYILLYFLDVFVYLLIFLILFNNLILIANLSDTKTPNKKNENQDASTENSYVSKIIKLILERANSSNRNTTFSLIIMIIIVIIGGSASFGTVALNEVNKIRELETERIKMLNIITILKDEQISNTDRNNEIKEILTSRYGNETSYNEVIKNIEQQSYISWPDIAMRITIAALTLFLVQIFFHIYKYNQQQASNLFTRAEVLELYQESDSNLDELRLGLLSKLDQNPKFDKSPTSPTEQFISIIKKKE
ncbi:hypothetical protein [Flavobacterium sp. 25HG05S-40]|uniref:hypothetical protein n=1 Tax=Flavobacterium sp. 25HG05S-40 TaxID=3458682 RepID=UPI004044488C